MPSKIFLDSGDPRETGEMIALLGSLDGQTTNPTLIAKNSQAQGRLARGEKFTQDEVYDFYKNVVREISAIIPDGSVSIEVYADMHTRAEEMIVQGREMYEWIPNAHIKLPTTKEGLKAAQELSQNGMRLNMTLVFSQSQAAAVYAATRGAKKGDIFVSPFIGRLDDKEENGMDLIENILKMYETGDGHVEALTASVRTMDHFYAALKLGSHIITAPYALLKEWGTGGKKMPNNEFVYKTNFAPIPYQSLDLANDWQSFPIPQPLTEKGNERYSEDWTTMIHV
jgi:transaldolase